MNQSEIDFMLINLSTEEAKVFFGAMLLLTQIRLAKGVSKDKNQKLENIYSNILSKIQ